MTDLFAQLLQSSEPSIRYWVRVRGLGEDPASPALASLREEIRASDRAAGLLAARAPDGRLPGHPYQKFHGAHWVLAHLAELGYPPGDESLIPLREQVLGWLLSADHLKKTLTINGLTRRCASQEGNALYALLSLGLTDERTAELARRLAAWQWPDGGWNCDKNPAAHHSSFMESLIPLRALALYSRAAGDPAARTAAERAAEFFLSHRLFRRTDGSPIHPEFLTLHYPVFWHYDILFGLTVMLEGGCLDDPRCVDALDELERLRLPDGGFPAGGHYYQVCPDPEPNTTPVAWGQTGRTRPNEFVTAAAACVLYCAGRIPKFHHRGSEAKNASQR